MLGQGHDSAPGLDIRLLKQHLLSLSGQAANPARQHPPVTYVYSTSHHLLQFLPQKLAEWIANNYAEELNVPLRPDPTQPWSTATLNIILQTCLVSDRKGNTIHTFQTEQTCIAGLCTPVVTHSMWNTIVFWEEMSRYVHIHGVCYVYNMYMSVIFFTYTWTNQILLTAGLFGNYPSSSILHWRV
jgi:hypothetical protein